MNMKLPLALESLSGLVPEGVVAAAVDALMEQQELRRREVDALEQIAAALVALNENLPSNGEVNP